MVVNKTYIARYWKPEPKDKNNLIAKMLPLFIFGIQFMATEKIVWNTTFYNLDIYIRILPNNTTMVLTWSKSSFCLLASITATALGKDLCLLASACLAKDSLAYNCNERQWKQCQSTNEVTLPSQRHHSWAKFSWLQTTSLIYTSQHQIIRTIINLW